MSEFPKTKISPELVAAIAKAAEEFNGVTTEEVRTMYSALTQGQEAGEGFKEWLVNLARKPLPADITERAKQAIEELNDTLLADDLLTRWQQGDITARPWGEVRKGLEEGE